MASATKGDETRKRGRSSRRKTGRQADELVYRGRERGRALLGGEKRSKTTTKKGKKRAKNVKVGQVRRKRVLRGREQQNQRSVTRRSLKKKEG